MFYNLTKELEKRGILRSDPRLTPVTTILKNIFLERLDRSGEMTQGIVGGSRELDICKIIAAITTCMCRVEGVEGCPTSNFDPESIENIKLDFSQFQKYILKL